MTAFDDAFRIVVGEEGGYTNNPADAGNWSGGQCGHGQCKGTKFGISAAAYPLLDIAALTLPWAKALYKDAFWDRLDGDKLPPSLALLVFDAAVNNGLNRATKWLQTAAGVAADGAFGPATLAAALRAELSALRVEFQAQRMMFMTGLPTWRTFGLGWARRLARLPYDAINMEETP